METVECFPSSWARSLKMTGYDSAEAAVRLLTGRDQQSIREPCQKGLKTAALSALCCGKTLLTLSHLFSCASEWERVWLVP